jgi:hypothetical protein
MDGNGSFYAAANIVHNITNALAFTFGKSKLTPISFTALRIGGTWSAEANFEISV